ncbi:epidermal growth factor receptor kinase substrate 8-like [Ruditapes philippinarum]|uniref:epidermal growth factor receptor kinase substrate 8-like n=1 Tax=Ruditapes philippinarum TaxID=129788 RepID=UPI00295BEA94|nr:epidermal growth factor receptor kinase substrate 8-like [Ruditapes philippinarum]XP_060588024.1 epidermal growth factor receptor kinase substrate 8-like [Ruditapes philippinarum]
MVRDYRTGDLSLQLSGIETAIKKLPGCSNVQLANLIFKEKFIEVMDDLAQQNDTSVVDENATAAEEETQTRQSKRKATLWEEEDTSFKTKLLNNCFDDIEKFVQRLQQIADAYKELEGRRLKRGGKGKQKSAEDEKLMMRARPPPADDFIDIFQKFKFAFNLLAHIHDPNAPELVHFLFSPLSLIYEASRDSIHGGRDLSSEAVAPLLLYDAKQLFLNCLTSNEFKLWQTLGRPWTLVKDEWSGNVPSYNPRFFNGWQPSPQLLDKVNKQDKIRDV